MENTDLLETLRSECRQALEPPPDVSMTRFGIPPQMMHVIIEKIVVTIVGTVLTKIATDTFRDWWKERKERLKKEIKSSREPEVLEAATRLLSETDERLLEELQIVKLKKISGPERTEIREEVRTVLIDSNFADEHAGRIAERLSESVTHRIASPEE